MTHSNYNAIGAETPQTWNPLPSAVNGLGFSIGQLDGVLLTLRDRLGAILTPQPPTPTSTDSVKQQLTAAPQPTSDLTSEISLHSRRIDSMVMVVNDLMDRLEV